MPTGPYDTSVTEALNAVRSQLSAGVMFDKALTTSSRACSGERRAAFAAAGARATDGADVVDVAAELIPVLSFAERAMFITAWNGGRIDAALAAIIDRRRLMSDIGRKIKAGMIQPVFVLFVASFVSPLPSFLAPKDAISINEYLARALAPLIVALAAWIAGRTLFVWRSRELAARGMREPPAPVTPLDRVMMYMPFVGHTEKLKNLAEFCSLLANLTLAGVQTREGLALLARAMPNGLYRREIDRIREATTKGQTIASAMKPGMLWPEDFINIIDVAETTGDLDTAMERQARLYLERYTDSIRRWGVFIARLVYALVCAFVIMHIFRVASGYTGLINNAAKGIFPN